MSTLNISDLLSVFPNSGEVVWIGLRPSREQSMVSVDQAQVNEKKGLLGDRYAGSSGSRHLTLIQWEHFAVLEAFTGLKISPEQLRRNLVIKGINLLALKNRRIRIGEIALLEVTGLCHPCSKMEVKLGAGGYNAMRGHGGVTARVLEGGCIKVGDQLTVSAD